MSISAPPTAPRTGQHLLVELHHDSLYFASYNPLEDDTYSSCPVTFASQQRSLCERVKESVYENPQLLQEYDRTYIVIDTPNFAFVPEGLEREEIDRHPYYDFCFPGHNDHIVENRIAMNRAFLLFGVDQELHGFLCRTFSNPVILHPLSTLCEYFSLHSRNGNEAKMYLHLREGRFDLIVFKQGRLLLGNTFDYTTPDDIIYFTLLAWKQLSLDQQRDRVYIAGAKSLRPAVVEGLQKYISSVLPYPFPAQLFRIGQSTIDAPFELITIPLCGL